MPPDSCQGNLSSKPASPTGPEQRVGLRAILAPSRGEIRCRCGCTISSGSSTLSMVVRHGSRVGFWNAMPAILTGRVTARRRRRPRRRRAELQPGHELHQRRLAAAGRTDHRGEFAAANGEARVLQGQNATRPAAIGQGDIPDVDGGGHSACPRRNPPVSSTRAGGRSSIRRLCLTRAKRDYWTPRLRGAWQRKEPCQTPS